MAAQLTPDEMQAEIDKCAPFYETVQSYFERVADMLNDESPKHVINVTNDVAVDTALELYGLRMQASRGDVQGLRPSLFDEMGAKRWDAWSQYSGLPQEQAERRFLSVAEAVLREHGYSDLTDNNDDHKEKKMTARALRCLNDLEQQGITPEIIAKNRADLERQKHQTDPPDNKHGTNEEDPNANAGSGANTSGQVALVAMSLILLVLISAVIVYLYRQRKAKIERRHSKRKLPLDDPSVEENDNDNDKEQEEASGVACLNESDDKDESLLS